LFSSTIKLSHNHTDIKCCCNTVHAVNFRRELVLENAASGSLKVLEFQYQNIVGSWNPVDTGLLHCMVSLFTPQLSLVLIVPTYSGMARLSA